MMSRLMIAGVALGSSALATESSHVILSSTQSSKTVQLVAKKYEPITEQRPYQTTCSREVHDHDETSCSTVDRQSCSGGGTVCSAEDDQVCNSQGCTTIQRMSCRTEPESCTSTPETSCSSTPVYRTETYSCTEYETVVVGQRLVKTFNHTIEVMIDRPEVLAGQELKLAVNANDADVGLSLQSSFNTYLLTVEKKKISESDAGTEATISTRLTIKVDFPVPSLNQILTSSIQNLELTYSGIRFDLKGLADLSKHLNINVGLVQQRRIFRDLVLFSGTIDSSTLSLKASGDDLRVSIPVGKMDLNGLNSKKHDLRISVSFKKPTLEILNAPDLSEVLSKKIEAGLQSVHPE